MYWSDIICLFPKEIIKVYYIALTISEILGNNLFNKTTTVVIFIIMYYIYCELQSGHCFVYQNSILFMIYLLNHEKVFNSSLK